MTLPRADSSEGERGRDRPSSPFEAAVTTGEDTGAMALPDTPLPSDADGGSDGRDAAATDAAWPTDGPAEDAEQPDGAVVTVDCAFTVITNAISPQIPTVGIVEWSTALPRLQDARIVYTLRNSGGAVLNRGGTAPVDLSKTNHRTLLLGLKPGSEYTFHIEATSEDGACTSPEYAMPRTGVLAYGPTVARVATNGAAQAKGFIVTSGGMFGAGAYIIDADGTVVWATAAPPECSRARMDYEGANMWMLRANATNAAGEMRYVSMDGMTGQPNVSGLQTAHHDFTVVPGKIVALAWATAGGDVESNLVAHAADGSGSTTTVFKIGANLYQGKSAGAGRWVYHANSILYHPADDSFTIGDRYPNLYVKARRDGTLLWQIGGSCSATKAPKCAAGTWTVNHGHHVAANGNLLIFNNDDVNGSRVLELAITESDEGIAFAEVAAYTAGQSSSVLGDVQRLPNGNTLITFSTAGQIVEVDPDWHPVQTLKAAFGYADWRETLYGPPAR